MFHRLVIFLEELYEREGSHIYGQFNWLLYAAEIAKHFAEATIFLPIKPREPEKTALSPPFLLELAQTNFHLVELPPYYSLANSMLRLPQVIRQFYQHRHTIRGAQAILIRVPSLAGLLLAEFARLLGTANLSFYVAGNIETQANPIVQGGSKGSLVGLLARLVNRFTALAARNSLVISVSPEMAAKFQEAPRFLPPPRKVLTFPVAMHTQTHLYRRPRLKKKPPLRLIRVCRLYPSKGLETLLVSVQLLLKQGVPVRLEIVGAGDPGYQQRLEGMLKDLNLGPYVTLSGPMPHQEIMSAYRRADIQVISSLAEGTPRVIWEGWANSLPLVATAVGGIPDMVAHEINGLLVPPGDPVALAEAVARLYWEPGLRQKLSANGLALAREYTLEKQAALVAQAIRNF